MTPLLALALLAAPADTPIVPIDETTTVENLATPAAEAVCTQIADTVSTIDLLGVIAQDPAVSDMLYDMAVTYFIQAAEEGAGPDAAFTAEAEEIFIGWVDDCSGHLYAGTP